MANLIWNLDDLFKSKKDCYHEIKKITKQVDKLNKIKVNDSFSLFNLLEKAWQIKEVTNNILIYGSFKYYKDVNNEDTIKLKEKVENFNNETNYKLQFVDNIILDFGNDKINEMYQENKKLEKYKLYIDNLFRKKEHLIKSDELINNNNLINKYLTDYNKLLHNMQFNNIVVDNEKIDLNITNYSKYLNSKNRDIRKQTFINVDSAYKEKAKEYFTILDNIYSLRIKNIKLEKYNSVLEKVLFEEKIDSKIVDNLILSVNNHLFLIQNYLNIKANKLKIKKPHLYDFGVNLNENIPKYSLEDAIKIIKESLKPLGDEYLKAVDILLDGHIDASFDNKKHQSITFSWNTYSFLNYKGTYNDLKNLIHELGHIVNYYLSKQNQPFIYEDSTIFVGEIASITNEILLNRYLYNNAKTKEEKIFYLSKEIENYFTTVFKQTLYTELELRLYILKDNNRLTSNNISNIYYNLIKRYYGNQVAYDSLAKYEWMRLGHLYRYAFYPYKYATGLMLASIVVNGILDNTIKLDSYITFLKSGSSKYSLDLLKDLGINLSNLNIFNKGFNILKEDIEKLEELLEKDYV